MTLDGPMTCIEDDRPEPGTDGMYVDWDTNDYYIKISGEFRKLSRTEASDMFEKLECMAGGEMVH